MLYDETAVRANIRNREGRRVFYLDKGDQLTSTARDYLSRERIPILPAGQDKPQVYRLSGGGFVTEKPEHMTHLNAQVLVPKTHPRILFRGAMDTLQAELLLCALAHPMAELEEILDFARTILRCEVLEEPLEPRKLCGMTEQELRSHSHRPQDFYGQPHFMPSVADGSAVLHLNRCRCAARQAELRAVAAFSGEEGVKRGDILQAMNRMSSLLYILMIKEKAASHA